MSLKYNKFYVGLSKGGQPFNFVLFRPRKSTINVEVKLDETEEIDTKIEQAGIEALDYDARWGRYRLALHKDDIAKHRPLLKELLPGRLSKPFCMTTEGRRKAALFERRSQFTLGQQHWLERHRRQSHVTSIGESLARHAGNADCLIQ